MSSKHKSRSTQAQKKLSQVKSQLYGKDEVVVSRSNTPTMNHLSGTYSFIPKDKTSSSAYSFTAKDTPPTQIKSFVKSLDTDYLKRDLQKIALLSTLAIGAQIGLLFFVNRLSF